MRRLLSILCLVTAILALPGCAAVNALIRNGKGMAFEIDGDLIGTGQPAVVPADGHDYWNGEPMDMRNR